MSDNVTSIDGMDGTDEAPAAAEGGGDVSGGSERLAAARQKFTDAVEGVGRKAKGASEKVREGAAKATEKAREGARQGYDKVSNDLDQLTEDVNEYVRHNPGKSIAIAAGVGFLIGMLLRGRRD